MPAEPSPPPPPPAPAGPERRATPRWILPALLVALGGWFVITQVVSRSGPAIQWIYDDLARAEQLARERDQRVFLFLHEPGCPVAQALELNLFSKHEVKRRLAGLVCCRAALTPTDRLRLRFVALPPGVNPPPPRPGQPPVYVADLASLPRMLVLQPGRAQPLANMAGQVDELQFRTYVDLGTGE